MNLVCVSYWTWTGVKAPSVEEEALSFLDVVDGGSGQRWDWLIHPAPPPPPPQLCQPFLEASARPTIPMKPGVLDRVEAMMVAPKWVNSPCTVLQTLCQPLVELLQFFSVSLQISSLGDGLEGGALNTRILSPSFIPDGGQDAP